MSKLEDIQLWKAYHIVSDCQSSQDLIPYQFPISLSSGLPESIPFLAKKLKIPLDGVLDYFSNEKNPNFHKDTLDPNKIDFKSFQMRLNNFLLEKIHSQGDYSETIHEFLYSSYQEREEKQGREVESDLEEQKDEKIFLSGLTSEVLDEVRNEKPEKVKKNKEEPKKNISEIKEKKFSEFEHKWNSLLLEKHHHDIEQIFKSFEKNGKIKSIKLQDLVKKVLNAFGLHLIDEDFHSFSEILENFYCQPANHTKKSLKLQFTDLTQALTLWGEKYNESRRSFKSKLQKTHLKICDLSTEFFDSSSLAPILKALKKKLNNLIENFSSKTHPNSFQQVIQKNIEEIFLFYAKSQKIQGAEDTFEGLESSNTSWNLGKFLRFCQDFELTVQKYGITKDLLSGIFKKIALNTRIMDQNCFVLSLGKIAEAYYSPQYDKDHQSALAAKSLQEKREMLFKLLKLDKVNSCYEKLKGFNVPHTPEDKIRIPKTQVKKLNYSYKLPESFIQQVDNWKKRQNNISHLTPDVRIEKSIANALKNERLRRSSNEVSSPKIGYAQKLKKRNQNSQMSPTSVLKKEFFSEQEDDENVVVKGKVQLGQSQGKVVTIKDLNKLDFNDFDENDMKELITEGQDEYFEKIYKIEPKLQGILKMHQDKVAKGIKVADKSRMYSDKKIYK